MRVLTPRLSRSALRELPSLVHHCSRLSLLASTSSTVPSSSRGLLSFVRALNSNGAAADGRDVDAGTGRIKSTTFTKINSASNEERKNRSNTNPDEVKKFSSFASHWWDSRSNPLIGMNPIRVKFLREIVGEFQATSNTTIETIRLPFQNKRILDIGCGGGLLTESLSRLGASLVVAVDASTEVVEVAKSHSFHENSRLRSKRSGESIPINESSNSICYIGGMTVEELASHRLKEKEKEQTLSQTSESPNLEQFDIITALEVIEHVPNPASLLHAATSLLKPNGILFVSTINRTMKSYGLAIIAAEYITGKVPVGTHDWKNFWCPLEIEGMICGGNSGVSSRNATLKQIGLSGMVIKPPYVNMRWSLDPVDVDVNWIGAYQKQIST